MQRSPVRSAVVTVPGGDAGDFFAAHNLEKVLAEDGVTISRSAGMPDVTVVLLRKNSPSAAKVLAGRNLFFDPVMHDEGYILVSAPGRITVIGDTAAGVFYGVQTLKQLVEFDGSACRIWTGTVRDWPAMKYRGVHDDLSRGPFPSLAFQKHQLEVFAANKVNLYSPYFEHTLQYSGDPLAAPPGSSLTRADARELVVFASHLHIMIVPEQEAFGHLHHVLQYEKYADVAETPQSLDSAIHCLSSGPLNAHRSPGSPPELLSVHKSLS
jgi:N-acetyl-beta-hexosaminidase